MRHGRSEDSGAGCGAVSLLCPLVVAVHLGGTPGLRVTVYGGAGCVRAASSGEEREDAVGAIVPFGGCGVVHQLPKKINKRGVSCKVEEGEDALWAVVPSGGCGVVHQIPKKIH